MRSMSLSAKLFIGAMATAGVLVLTGGLMHWESKDPVCFVSFLTMAAIASRLKVKLPGTTGNMSVNLPFILIALTQLSFPETIVLVAVSAFVQSLPGQGKRAQPVQALFNVSTLIMAVAAADLVYRRSAAISTLSAQSLMIALAGAIFLLADTAPVAGVIFLTENLNLLKVWREMLELTFSYFALSAGIAAIAATATRYVGWQTPVLVLPVMIAAYVSYRRYFRFPVAAMANL
jgi:MASE9 protein